MTPSESPRLWNSFLLQLLLADSLNSMANQLKRFCSYPINPISATVLKSPNAKFSAVHRPNHDKTTACTAGLTHLKEEVNKTTK